MRAPLIASTADEVMIGVRCATDSTRVAAAVMSSKVSPVGASVTLANLRVRCERRDVDGDGVGVEQAGARVERDDLLGAAQPARLTELRDRREARGALGARPRPFVGGEFALRGEQCVVADGDGRAAGCAYGVEYEEVAERL